MNLVARLSLYRCASLTAGVLLSLGAAGCGSDDASQTSSNALSNPGETSLASSSCRLDNGVPVDPENRGSCDWKKWSDEPGAGPGGIGFPEISNVHFILDQARATDGSYSATFLPDISLEGPFAGCTLRYTQAACTLVTCPVAAPSAAADGGPAALPDTGNVTVTGSLLPPTGLSLLTSNGYAPVVDAARVSEPGQHITFASSGDGRSLGPFSLTVPTGADIELEEPVLPRDRSTVLELDLNKPLTLRWKSTEPAPGTGISVDVGTVTATETKDLLCRFKADLGTAQITLAALDPVPATTATTSGSLSITPGKTTSVMVADADGTRSPVTVCALNTTVSSSFITTAP